MEIWTDSGGFVNIRILKWNFFSEHIIPFEISRDGGERSALRYLNEVEKRATQTLSLTENYQAFRDEHFSLITTLKAQYFDSEVAPALRARNGSDDDIDRAGLEFMSRPFEDLPAELQRRLQLAVRENLKKHGME
jgi:hypothetical protein